MLGIYVHIPFCERKCLYCAFSSFVASGEERERYVDHLTKEISAFHNKYEGENYRKVDTIYFGGGTPSILNTEDFKKIVKTIKENFDIAKDYEFTVECNPNSLTEEKLITFKEEGVNRISLGVQSLNEEALKFIGRLHNCKEALGAIKLAKKYFDNVSVDVLIGLPKIQKGDFINDLSRLINEGVKHISAYMLQVEEGTPLQKLVNCKPALLPDDDECVEIYEEASKFLSSKGYERYEVSNFAIKDFESRHNFKYWTGEEYVGFGLSSHSLLKNERIANASDFNSYYNEKGKMREVLGKKELIEEHIMLGLRCKNGISKDYLKKIGYDITKCQSLNDFIKRDVVTEKGDRIYLNPSYYGINNFIIASLLPEI